MAGSVIASIYNLGAKPSRTFEPFKEWVVDPIVKFKNTKKSAKEDSDFFSKERGLIGSIDNVAMLCGGVVGTVLVGLPAGVAFLQVISGEDLKKGGSPTLGYTGRAASAVYDKVRDWTWNTPAHAVGSLFGVNEEDALTAPKNLPKDTIHWHDAVKTMKPSKSAVHKP